VNRSDPSQTPIEPIAAFAAAQPPTHMTQEQTSQTMTPEDKAKLWAEADAQDAQQATGTAAAANDAELASAAQETAPAQQAAVTEQAEKQDPYAALPDEIKNEIIGLKSILSQTTSRLRNAEGHIGGLRSQIMQATAAQQAQQAQAAAPTKSELSRAEQDPEAMRQLQEDYPEFGAAMKAALREQMSAFREEMRAVINQPPAQLPSITAEHLQSLRSELTVEARHPGWKDTVSTPAFAGWLQQQPREVQMLASSSDARDAIRLLDIQRETAQQSTQQRNQRLASAAAIPSGRANTAREKPVEQMNKAEYWAYLDSIDRNKR
jgi:hypothetical protein